MDGVVLYFVRSLSQPVFCFFSSFFPCHHSSVSDHLEPVTIIQVYVSFFLLFCAAGFPSIVPFSELLILMGSDNQRSLC